MERYRNIRTGQVIEDTDGESVFARSSQWELVEGKPRDELLGLAEGMQPDDEQDDESQGETPKPRPRSKSSK